MKVTNNIAIKADMATLAACNQLLSNLIAQLGISFFLTKSSARLTEIMFCLTGNSLCPIGIRVCLPDISFCLIYPAASWGPHVPQYALRATACRRMKTGLLTPRQSASCRWVHLR